MTREIKVIGKDDPDFPASLTGDKFNELRFWGEWEKEKWQRTVAIVGSRKMSRYAEEVIEMLVPGLVAKKFTIISGFMYGVDQEVHRICCKSGGITAAILGYGLGYYQLSSYKRLVDEILTNKGLVVSPFKDDFKSTQWSFPQRNRIVAALSTLGIIVVEADLESGSLITAKLGSKMGKQIWAVPGPITSRVSRGTNWLVKTGRAKMLTDIGDLFEGSNQQLKLIEPDSDPILKELAYEPLSPDQLAVKVKRPVSEITSRLSVLLLEDRVTEADGVFRLIRSPD